MYLLVWRCFPGGMVRRFCVAAAPLRDNSLPPNRMRGNFSAYDENKEWASYKLAPHLLQRTRELGFKGPSCIQDIAIPMILEDKHRAFVIGAETGSGKTLAYLLPVLHQLLSTGTQATRARAGLQGEKYPFAVITVPNIELAYQCKSVIAHLLSGTKFSVGVACKESAEPGQKTAPPFPAIGSFPTLLVTTPLTLSRHWNFSYSLNVRYLVIDEADLMLQEAAGHFDALKKVLMEVRFAQKDFINVTKQTSVIFAGATFGEKKIASKIGRSQPGFNLRDAVSKQFVGAKWITSPLLHFKLPNIRHEFIFNYMDQVEAKKSKLLALLKNRLSPHHTHLAAHQAGPDLPKQGLAAAGFMDPSPVKEPLVKSDGKSSAAQSRRGLGQKVLVFFNDIRSLEYVSSALTAKGYIHGVIHEQMLAAERIQTLKHFHAGTLRLLCTTSLLARGVDFVKVNCVIQYEMARNITDHIHRIGRTARGGTSGQAFSFYHQFDYGLVQAIKACGEGDLKPAFVKTKTRTKSDRFPVTDVLPSLASMEVLEPLEQSLVQPAVDLTSDRWLSEEKSAG